MALDNKFLSPMEEPQYLRTFNRRYPVLLVDYLDASRFIDHFNARLDNGQSGIKSRFYMAWGDDLQIKGLYHLKSTNVRY